MSNRARRGIRKVMPLLGPLLEAATDRARRAVGRPFPGKPESTDSRRRGRTAPSCAKNMAGIAKPAHIYTLRHSFVIYCWKRNMDVRVIQVLLDMPTDDDRPTDRCRHQDDPRHGQPVRDLRAGRHNAATGLEKPRLRAVKSWRSTYFRAGWPRGGAKAGMSVGPAQGHVGDRAGRTEASAGTWRPVPMRRLSHRRDPQNRHVRSARGPAARD